MAHVTHESCVIDISVDCISFKKYFVCLPEYDFSIEFPITFTFVPEVVENLQEQPIDCESGKKQITAFECGTCPDGYSCKYPNSPVLCEVQGSLNDIVTRDSPFRTK